MKYYVVKYQGTFGFIKPWTAVRDELTFSQTFLSPSIIRGLELKLFPDLPKLDRPRILRHRLCHDGFVQQQERTQSKGGGMSSKKSDEIKKGILIRQVMLNPQLYLAFEREEEALQASTQSLCLCRNEDLIFPEPNIRCLSAEEFEALDGFECLPSTATEGILLGYNRYEDSQPMYGKIIIVGNPVQSYV
jgi:hypothetical protein